MRGIAVGYVRVGSFAIFCTLACPFSAFAVDPHVDVNDISILWPPPDNRGAVDTLISGSDELNAPKTAIWPSKAFQAVLETAQSVTVMNSAGGENKIAFSQFAGDFKNPKNWKVAAIRVDPSAPGTAPMVTKAVGSIPQVRLIMQPVTVSGAGKVTVHDLTAHLVFNFVSRFDPPVDPRLPPKAIPDKDAFGSIIKDLVALKETLKEAGIQTDGELTIHPGFRKPEINFTEKIKVFLRSHLTEDRLSAVAFMGIQAPEPWIFFAMKNADGALSLLPHQPLGGQVAQMLTFRGGTNVLPKPTTTNLETTGVSTSILFATDVEQNLKKPAIEGREKPLQSDIPDIIANPQISNFGNTDCISCHTESSRRVILKIDSADEAFRFRQPEGISGVDKTLLPNNRWNVRNFGWFPSGNSAVATATTRLANEAADSADFINREYLAK